MKTIFLILTLLLSIHTAQAQEARLIVLCYHDIVKGLAGEFPSDSMAVGTHRLAEQFSWLKEHNYHPVSMQQVIDARDKGVDLPERAVLLTFDDGYLSFYEYVYPLLKLFNYPAVAAVVGHWLNVPAGQMVQYGATESKPREHFMSWKQVRELQQSNLVEIASHSYNLHQGIMANPQGNTQPAAVTRFYDRKTASYEDKNSYVARIYADLKNSAEVITKHTGVKPRVMVWPYGAHSGLTIDIAKRAGMPITFTLLHELSDEHKLDALPRILMTDNQPIAEFAYTMRHPHEVDPIRVAHVDLDYVYDKDPVQTDKNLGLLIERIRKLGVNTVYLQAFADPDGDGNAEALYFPNRHLPVRADLFNRVAWQLRGRGGVKVYAWMPVLAFKTDHPEWLVKELKGDAVVATTHNYQRLSPFNQQASQFIQEIYEDLGTYTNFAGVIFHDDALMTDYEDMGSQALAHASSVFGKPVTAQQLRTDPALRAKWGAEKTRVITDFTKELAKTVRYFQGDVKTARNIYAEVVLNPASEEWFAQSYTNFLDSYDYTAIMAMPYMEKALDPQQWLNKLTATAMLDPRAAQKTIFELQAVDWNTKQAIPSATIAKQLYQLKRAGVRQLGYYPDNFVENHPQITAVKDALSMQRQAYLP